MAWTHIQSAGETTGSGLSANVSFSSSVGIGNVVAGFFITTAATNVFTSMTDDKGNSYTIVDFLFGSTVGLSVWSFWGGPFSNGPITITVNVSPSQVLLWIAMDEFSPGGAGLITLDGHSIAANVTITSGNFTTTNNGDLIFGALGCNAATTAGAGFTLLNNLNGGNFDTEWQVQGAAGTIAATFNPSGGNANTAGFALAFTPSVVGGGSGFFVTEW
jgi:hypothetical protein